MPITELPGGGLGAAITPEQWATYVLEHLAAQSVVLASGATRINTINRVVHVPRVLTDGAANWYSELEEIADTGPTGDDLVLTPKKVAALVRLSSESVDDSNPQVLDTVGTAMTRAVALQADAAILVGKGGKAPVGVVDKAATNVPGPITIETLITAAGHVSAVGGTARVVYINPADWTTVQLSKDKQDRPLLESDWQAAPAQSIYGLVPYPTPAMPAGTALVADPAQIVVVIRQDPSVAVSTDALFTSDGQIARVIARLDAGVNDARGLVRIGVEAMTAGAKK